MQNIRLTLQYDGSRYQGWQKPGKLPQKKTVSHRISAALERITGGEITLYAGARTETGVHALSQTVNFYTEAGISPREIKAELNRCLPMDIAVLTCETAPDRFRADLNARSRTYEYRICTAPVYDIFTAPYSAHIYPAPDMQLMREGAGLLLGRHDFLPFSRAHRKKSTSKELYDIDIRASDATVSTLKITVTADDFLYQMPSLIIGALLEIGRGTRTPQSILHIFQGTEKAEALCESKGLLLKSIQYKTIF